MKTITDLETLAHLTPAALREYLKEIAYFFTLAGTKHSETCVKRMGAEASTEHLLGLIDKQARHAGDPELHEISDDVIQRIDEIDACVYSGDTFMDNNNREWFRAILARWDRGMATFDAAQRIKWYITFGQNHAHAINGHTLDKDCVAVITGPDAQTCDALAFEWFDGKFHDHQGEIPPMQFFPRGLIEIN